MLKDYNRHISVAIILLVGSMMLLSCSTKKNTAATRSFHQTKVKYNIFFNGNTAYEEGLITTMKANEDDFTHIIPLYPVSNHKAAEASTSQMDRTIEKCRKCIKLHSIKAKPKPDPKKRSDPAYKIWLQSEEFNNQMGNVWVRLGEAEFNKGDFLGSIGTLTYVIRHYQNDPDVVARCQLTMARAYAELDWQYEAEDMINKVSVDALTRKNAPLYAAAKADVLLHGAQYKEAIPFIKLAIPNEKRKIFRPRFYFVLAQIYEHLGKKTEAIDAYKKCIKMAPAPAMDFNARVNRSILDGTSSVKSLLRMTKLSKHKDQLDRIYGAVGQIYLAAGDTTKALENFELAIEKSTTAGTAKAAILVQAGDLYFGRRQYVEAQPCYTEAATLLSTEHEQYSRVQKRAEILDELIVEFTTVQLQDSLQRLSHMSEQEQLAIVEKIIADLKAAEEKAAEDDLIAKRETEHGGLQGIDTRNMLGGGFGGSAEWYFYNEQLIKGGKKDFIKLWGNRPLEDNWRRQSKSATVALPTSGPETEDEKDLALDSLATDSTASTLAAAVPKETDPHQPAYYLQQIPRTPEDIALSDTLIATALYNLIYIYEDKVEDHLLAKQTYDEFLRRFPNDGRLLDLYYYYYLQALRNQDTNRQTLFRSLLLAKFPDSDQAKIVSQPDYFDRLRHMAAAQDSLYDHTYTAYHRSDFKTVKADKIKAETDYPLSPLMPRFLFLNAVAVARTDGQKPFIEALRDLVTRYPESEMSAMAKDFLAMMGQGMKSKKGAMDSDLDQLRGQSNTKEEEVVSDKTLSRDRRMPSVVLLILPSEDEAVLNQLLYEVALFNFSQFMIKDFDLQKLPVWGTTCALRVSGLESLDEAEWYEGLMMKNEALLQFLNAHQIKTLPITEDNLSLVPTKYSVEEYQSFISKKK